jgi:hypothetical protein
VARHKTAIARRDLSQPMQLAVAHGVLPPGSTVFDYGCGLGDDVAALSAAGFEAFGWDPHHAPEGPRRPADLVNLGFVMNVVEDRHERAETLKAAWSHQAPRLLDGGRVAAEESLDVPLDAPGQRRVARRSGEQEHGEVDQQVLAACGRRGGKLLLLEQVPTGTAR